MTDASPERPLPPGGGPAGSSSRVFSYVGVATTMLFWLAGVSMMLTLDASPVIRVAALLALTVIGVLAGVIVNRAFSSRQARQNARAANDFREEQEREFQRKLAEARAKGDI